MYQLGCQFNLMIHNQIIPCTISISKYAGRVKNISVVLHDIQDEILMRLSKNFDDKSLMPEEFYLVLHEDNPIVDQLLQTNYFYKTDRYHNYRKKENNIWKLNKTFMEETNET